jgi:hypothetical protein
MFSLVAILGKDRRILGLFETEAQANRAMEECAVPGSGGRLRAVFAVLGPAGALRSMVRGRR